MNEVAIILEGKGLSQGFLGESAKKMIELAIDNKDLKEGANLLSLAGKWLSMESPTIKQVHKVTENVAEQIGNTIKNYKLEKQSIKEGIESGREITPTN